MFPFEDFFHPGKQKQVTWVKIGWIGKVGHGGHAGFGQKLLNNQRCVGRCTRKSPITKWANTWKESTCPPEDNTSFLTLHKRTASSIISVTNQSGLLATNDEPTLDDIGISSFMKIVQLWFILILKIPENLQSIKVCNDYKYQMVAILFSFLKILFIYF